jgi:hypothetical protein
VRDFGGAPDSGAFERQLGDMDDAIFSSEFEAYCDGTEDSRVATKRRGAARPANINCAISP